MKKFEFEKAFTQSEYDKFFAAVEWRVAYEFQYGGYKDKMQVTITGNKCGNGIWAPEDYYWSIDVNDRRGGYSGASWPFRVGEMKTYDWIIDYVYAAFKLELPAAKQLSFF